MPIMKALLFAPLLCLAVAGCLPPDDYRAEVTLDKSGAFATRFDGDLAHLIALRDLNAGRIDAAAADTAFAEALKEVSGVVADTRREPGVHTAAFARAGQLNPGVNALPGPARFLLVEVKDGKAVVATPTFTDYQLKQLKGFGRQSRGEVCVRTDAQVLSHNAQATPDRADGCYLWKLDILAGDRLDMRLQLEP